MDLAANLKTPSDKGCFRREGEERKLLQKGVYISMTKDCLVESSCLRMVRLVGKVELDVKWCTPDGHALPTPGIPLSPTRQHMLCGGAMLYFELCKIEGIAPLRRGSVWKASGASASHDQRPLSQCNHHQPPKFVWQIRSTSRRLPAALTQ